MPSHRLEQQYQKLYARFGDQPVETHLQQLAELLFCTRRHVRNLLNQMVEAGWIDWHASAGRGRLSQLQCRYSSQAIQHQQAEQLLAAGRFEQAVQLIGSNRSELARLLFAHLGHYQETDRQILRVPYYRPMPNLYPGTALRRSEVHLVRQIFSALTRVNEEKGEVEADLAHHWTSPDQQHWVFYLRPSVTFHDGKPLQAMDVVVSLNRIRGWPLFAHIVQVQALDARRVYIQLQQPDARLPRLLADTAAMILPADHASRPLFAACPVGTGPYRVAENSALRLRLQAFDAYFGLRALLDEIDIWMWPELADQLELGERQVCELEVQGSPTLMRRTSLAAEPAAPAELVLEQGGYFLLCDHRSRAWASPSARRWLQSVLNSYQLMSRVPLAIRKFWAPAASLLPQWLHEQSKGELKSPWVAPLALAEPVLRLAYYEQQPEYRMLAEVMRHLLAEQGIQLDLIELAYAQWLEGERQADLWLGSINFSAPIEWSLGAWLLGTPLLRKNLSGGDTDQLTRWLALWRSEQLSSEALMAEVAYAGWLQPLFHHWLRLQGPAQARGIRLNNLGWFDFKSAWLEPAWPTDLQAQSDPLND